MAHTVSLRLHSVYLHMPVPLPSVQCASLQKELDEIQQQLSRVEHLLTIADPEGWYKPKQQHGGSSDTAAAAATAAKAAARAALEEERQRRAPAGAAQKAQQPPPQVPHHGNAWGVGWPEQAGGGGRREELSLPGLWQHTMLPLLWAGCVMYRNVES